MYLCALSDLCGEVVLIMEIIQDGCDRGGHWGKIIFRGK